MTREDFVELDAGPCRLAIHSAHKMTPGRTKMAFYVRDVAATRRKLEARGAKMGKLLEGRGVVICDGQDPAGNRFQITSRR
jgi:predicted enzyme related to lactoylglutathione lyase